MVLNLVFGVNLDKKHAWLLASKSSVYRKHVLTLIIKLIELSDILELIPLRCALFSNHQYKSCNFDDVMLFRLLGGHSSAT